MARIGIVTTSYPRAPGDPAGSFVAAHASALAALGHDVEVVSAHDVGAARGLFDAGGAPDAIEAALARGSLRVAITAASFSARLVAHVARRARRWDAIAAHWLAPSALAALASPSRAPLLAIAHGGDIYTLRRLGLLPATLAALHARGARLVFVSEALRAVARAAVPAWLAAYVDAARVQPMGIDVAHFARLPRAPTSPPTIAIAARLVPIKGVDVAIAALAQLRARAELVIAGDGPERASLELAARRAGVRAQFLGAVSTTARDALLACASVVAIPSRELATGRAEGAPMIAVEALAAGAPVVATATGGLRALAASVHLVAPDRADLLAAALDDALAERPTPEFRRASVAHLDWRNVSHVLDPTHLAA